MLVGLSLLTTRSYDRHRNPVILKLTLRRLSFWYPGEWAAYITMLFILTFSSLTKHKNTQWTRISAIRGAVIQWWIIMRSSSSVQSWEITFGVSVRGRRFTGLDCCYLEGYINADDQPLCEIITLKINYKGLEIQTTIHCTFFTLIQ